MDSDILTNLKTAIMTKFKAVDGDGEHNSYFNSIGGRLSYGRVSSGMAFPYSVFSIVSHGTDRTFTEDHRDILVQFSHFSDDPNSSNEAELIGAYCSDLFDECDPFTITGATLEWMRLSSNPGTQADEVPSGNGTKEGWHCPVDFEVRVSMK